MKKYIATLIISFAIVAPLFGQHWLPKEAVVVYSNSWSDGFLPDGASYIKVKTNKEGFEAIVKTLKLTPHTEDRQYTDDKEPWLSWGGARDPKTLKPIKGEKLWDPYPDLSTTFVRQKGDSWVYAKFEGGYVYYTWINH